MSPIDKSQKLTVYATVRAVGTQLASQTQGRDENGINFLQGAPEFDGLPSFDGSSRRGYCRLSSFNLLRLPWGYFKPASAVELSWRRMIC